MSRSLWDRADRLSSKHLSLGHDSMDLQAKIYIRGGEPMYKLTYNLNHTKGAVAIQQKSGHYVARWVRKK